MRTLPEAVELLQQYDKNTAFTLTALRRMVKSGKLPCVEVANKRLVNFDLLLERLSCCDGGVIPSAETGAIRPIPARLD